MKNILDAKISTINIEGKTIVRDLDLSIGVGDKIVLCGPSGKGKSTILNVLAGFYNDYVGDIKFFGKRVSSENISLIRENISWLPQNFNLEQGLVKNIFDRIFSFKANREKKPSIPEIESILDTLNLKNNILENNMENLSGGEKQRVGLAICYLQYKTLIILDEPTASLDEDSASKVLELFLKNNKLSVLSTSHDAKWIAACTRELKLK